MKVIRTIAELRKELSEASAKQVGLVPTMGYLHEGHASLMRRARQMCDLVVISIFVNPIQFGPNEDFETYPRDEQRDLAFAEQECVDVVFIPSVQEMYPTPTKTKIVVSDLTSSLCGASRPGHFDGVTTVVSKLFHIVKPAHAFFGMKDAQQVAVLQQMVMDLNMDVNIVPCPILREKDGLALSSRNVYLKPEEREQALVLSRSLAHAREVLQAATPITASVLREQLVDMITSVPLANIDYVEMMSFPHLEKLDQDQVLQEHKDQVLIALAVRFGATRLIDNILVNPQEVAVNV